ncbi:hypothetical protein QR680_003903 [Steinernema hermaphroditum]|uniref:Uncharacterized protein n=1 Tax=Steinernema hermaphroditum TaxID=289476 RepID=A0AA39HPA5_9BILA|nr:hypothetical protein QR680_003903 [Steinernema hermaphroditum]
MSHLTMIHHLLPKEMETIVKPFDWNAAAREDHQVELYLLDIDVYISEDKQIHLSVKKRLSNEQSAGPWDFQDWQRAQISAVRIHSDISTIGYDHRPSDLVEVAHIISLPVVPRSRSSLVVEGLGPAAMDVTVLLLYVTQKTFTDLRLWDCANGEQFVVEDFVKQYIEQEESLIYLGLDCADTKKESVLEPLLSLFKKKTKTSLKIEVPCLSFGCDEVEAFTEAWMSSDGFYEKREVSWGTSSDLEKLRSKYRPSRGYLAHPSKRSSISFNGLTAGSMRIVRFRRSHVSVDFDWIDSKIWKLQNGMDVAHCLDEVVLDSEKDWMEMVEWYGPVEVKTKSGYQVLQLDVHPDLISLEIENRGSHVAFTTKRTIMDNPMLKSLLFRWKVEGNGDYIINGRQKVVLLVEESAWNRLRGSKSGRVVVHHPTMNRRLLLEVEMNYSWGVAVRFSVLGIDTEASFIRHIFSGWFVESRPI